MDQLDGDLDPFVELLAADGTVVAQDDDGGGNHNSEITFQLPSDGTWTIRARSYEGRTFGRFELSLSRGAVGACGSMISYGEAVANQVPYPGGSCSYTFRGEAGDVIGVGVRHLTDALDPAVDLVDPDGNIIASSEGNDAGAGFGVIPDFRLEASGAYAIVARSRQGQTASPFKLVLWQGGTCGGVLTPGTTLFGQTTEVAPTCRYTLMGSVGAPAVFSAQALSEDFQAKVQIIGPDGSLVAEGTVGPGGQWGASRFAKSGTYTILVSSARGSTGWFELSFKPPRITPVSAGFCGGTVNFGELVEDRIFTEGSKCEFTFQGTAGDDVAVLMSRGNATLDPFLELHRPGTTSCTDDDSGGDRNSLIRDCHLETDGTYTILAGSYNNASAGQFYLTVWPH
jgi:hypothetical protein